MGTPPEIVEEYGQKGYWRNGAFYLTGTQVIVPNPIRERWFVYDWDNSIQIFDTKEEAEKEFLKVIQDHRDEAYDGWNEDVETITWGKVFQTVSLEPVEPPAGMDPEDMDSFEGDDFAEAFAVEHRKCAK